MPIEIEGPDGAIIEFPDNTPNDVMQNAMRKYYATQQPQQEQPQQEQQKGMLAAGLAGAGRAIAGMPGIVGDIQSLARKAEPYIGIKTPKNPWIQAPTSAEMVEKAAEYVPGIKYEPQTTGEKYAASVGSFLPGALMGGGGIARNALAFGVAPGLASEAAGQMTEGTAAEPYARVAGGLLGGMAGPALSNVPGRIISPITQSPRVSQAASLMEREGVPLMAGQKTQNKLLKLGEAVAGDITGADLNLPQSEAFTKAATRRMGKEMAQVEPADWEGIRTGFNKEYGDIASRNTLQMDSQFAKDVGDAAAEYISRTPVKDRAPGAIKQLQSIEEVAKSGGQLPGESYQAWRSRLDKARQGVKQSDPDLAEYYAGLRGALDKAMMRSLGDPADAALWADINKRYGAYKTLQKAAGTAGEEASQGYIPSAALRNAVQQRAPVSYLEGKSELGNLAKAARATMTPYPSSGTQQRTMMQKILSGIGPTVGAGSAAGALAGGPLGALGGAALGAVVPYTASRALLSRPVQAYLGNQAARRLGLLADVDRARRARGLLYGGATGYAGQPSR